MNWENGYTASYYMTVVDPVTWNDLERIEILGGSITRKDEGLRHAADISCKNHPQNVERWVRIYLDAKQDDNGAHEALFTGLAISPDRDIKGTWYENSVQCYSVLKPADDIVLTRGWYATTGVACSTLLEQLLTPIPAPIEIEDTTSSLESTIVAQAGETNLTMIERMLAAMNWNIRINGDGSIVIGPYPKDPSAVFDALNFDVIENQIKVQRDWYSCPNVFMAVNSYGTAIAKDESDDSMLSIQNRGREVWAYESGITLNQGESLEEYAGRRLKEEQQYYTTVSYDRRYIPDIMPGDIVTLHYPQQDLDGNFIITSQSINLGHSAKTSESVIGIIE